MKCLRPIIVSTPIKSNHTRNLIKRMRENGESPYIYHDSTSPYPLWRHQVPCGKCYACLSRRRDGWLQRLHYVQDNCQTSFFITLTYDEDNIPSNHVCDKRHLQLFIKNLREKLARKYGKRLCIKYFGVEDYGEKRNRPHYHVLLWNVPLSTDIDELLSECWQRGIYYVGSVTDASINYVCGYITQNEQSNIDDAKVVHGLSPDDDLDIRAHSLMSKHLGDGEFLSTQESRLMSEKGTDELIWRKRQIPRYLKEKLLTDEQLIELSLKHSRQAQESQLRKAWKWFHQRKVFNKPFCHFNEIILADLVITHPEYRQWLKSDTDEYERRMFNKLKKHH